MDGGDGNRANGWSFSDGTREFRLFPEQRQIFVGDAEIKDLGERGFDLLCQLVEHAGHVVPRAEIFAGAWGGIEVADSAVSTQIKKLRSIVSTAAIKTINNLGYQFTLPCRPTDSLVAATTHTRPLVTLPRASSRRIGRAAELDEIAGHCAENPVVTIAGPGGIGKTWLAVELAWRMAERFPDGMHLIDLAPVGGAAGVASATARALGVALRSGDSPAEIIGAAIGQRRMLLIFDSCEYVAAPAGELIGALLAHAPSLSVLATSQEVLRISDEFVFRLRTLPAEDAIALFVARARAAGASFQHTEKNAARIAEICRRLDGIPLALELAAALVPSLGIDGVSAGLDQRFKLLSTAPRTGGARQRTLCAMVDWSYGLLDAGDRRVFRRLACFAGSFSREAAIAVASADDIESWAVMTSLGRLVDKSLVVAEEGEQQRYRLLETLGLHARAELAAAGEAEATAERHAKHYTEFFHHAEQAREDISEDEWVSICAPEIDNIRAALGWRAAPGGHQLAIALAGVTGRVWERLGLLTEGRQHIEQMLELVDKHTPAKELAHLLRQAAILWRDGDRSRALNFAKRASDLYRQANNSADLGSTLGLLGGLHVYLGNLLEAAAALQEAETLLSGSNRKKSLMSIMNELGSLALLKDDAEEARRCYGIALDIGREMKDVIRQSTIFYNMGELEFRFGAIDRAIYYATISASGFQSAGYSAHLGRPLINLGSYLAVKGDDLEAASYAAEALSLVREEGGRWLRVCLQLVALIGARRGRYGDAARLIGFVDAGYIRSGEIREPTEQQIRANLTNLLRAHLAADDLRIWADDGALWDERSAAEFARALLI